MKSAIGLTRGNLHINVKKQLEITLKHEELADNIKTLLADIYGLLEMIRNKEIRIYRSR